METSDIKPEEYFSSYEDLEIHKLMIEDTPRTEAYRTAIFHNKCYFKDKVVMDVGCGTGILSIFCAQAGAKKVYAVEASNIAKLAKEIVKENNFEDVIEVIHSRVEDVTLPDNIKVDAIVSEWMGFYLLHEGMLDSVIVARDKFLKDDGEMFPEIASIYVQPCSVPESNYNENVYEVSMSAFAKLLKRNLCSKPQIRTVDPFDLIGDTTRLCWLNLKTVSIQDLDEFNLEHVTAASHDGKYQGLCVYFDCLFPNLDEETNDDLVLTTSPYSKPTHWKQTVIVLPQQLEVEKNEPIAYRLNMKRDPDYNRRYNLELTMLSPDDVDHPIPCSCYMTKCIITKTFIVQHPEKTENASNILKEQSKKAIDSDMLEYDNIEDGDED